MSFPVFNFLCILIIINSAFSEHYCDGIRSDLTFVCSGHGECVGTDNCICQRGYYGYSNCSVETNFKYLTGHPDSVYKGDTSNPSARAFSSLFHQVNDPHGFYITGGINGTLLNDVWYYNITEKKWTEVLSRTDAEVIFEETFNTRNRYSPSDSMGSVSTDTSAYLIQGTAGQRGKYYKFSFEKKQFHILRDDSNRGQNLTVVGEFDGGTFPSNSWTGMSVTYNKNTDTILLFGGYNFLSNGNYTTNGILNDLYEIEGDELSRFKFISGSLTVNYVNSNSSTTPPAMKNAIHWNFQNEKWYIYTCENDNGIYQLWSLGLASSVIEGKANYDWTKENSWTQYEGGPRIQHEFHEDNSPLDRAGTMGWVWGENLYFFGGYFVANENGMSSLWVYNLDLHQWKFEDGSLVGDDWNIEDNFVGKSSNVLAVSLSADEHKQALALLFVGYGRNEQFLDLVFSYDGYNCYRGFYLSEYIEFCSGHGYCVNYDDCVCHSNFTTGDMVGRGGVDCAECKEFYVKRSDEPDTDCYLPNCVGIPANERELVCNGKGDCVGSDVCDCYGNEDGGTMCSTCTDGFIGSYCEVTTCFGIFSNETEKVCSGHGICGSEDVCNCETGWSSSKNDICNFTSCDGIDMDKPDVCSSVGTCYGFQNCSCHSDFYGPFCAEKVQNVRFQDDTNRIIEIDYSILKFQFENIADKLLMIENEYFNCSNIVSNWDEFLYFNSSRCKFEFNLFDLIIEELVITIEISEKLVIEIMEESDDFEDPFLSYYDDNKNLNFTIFLRSITVPEKPIILSLTQLEQHVDPKKEDDNNDNNNDDDDDSDIRAEYLAFISIPILLLFVCVICCGCCFIICVCFCFLICFLFVSVCCICCVSRQQRKLLKYSKLDNIELLLKDQESLDKTTGPKFKLKTKKFEISYSNIKLLEQIGSGGSDSIVFKILYQNIECAFKSFRNRKFFNNENHGSFEEFEKEVSIISSISHLYILRFYGVVIQPPILGIITEYCVNRDIKYFLSLPQNQKNQNKNENLKIINMKTKIRFLREISSGMDCLHSNNIIHRDLKCANVLLDESLTCKIMDFGLSRIIDSFEDESLSKGIGTSHYISPEITRGEDYNFRADIFSFGMVCWEIISSNFDPFKDGGFNLNMFSSENNNNSNNNKTTNQNYQKIEYKIANNPFFRPDLSKMKKCPKYLKRLAAQCWDSDPMKRPESFDKISKYLQNEKSMTTIYLKMRDQKDIQAEDFSLYDISIEEIRKIVCNNKLFSSNSNNSKKVKINEDSEIQFFLRMKKEKEIELKNNQILEQNIQDGSMIIFEILKNKNENKNKRKVEDLLDLDLNDNNEEDEEFEEEINKKEIILLQIDKLKAENLELNKFVAFHSRKIEDLESNLRDLKKNQ